MKVLSITRWQMFALIAIFLLFVFLRFFDLEGRLTYAWDQVQNAWVMKDMLADGKLPLEGMPAKLNSGFRIGPGYYYLLAPFYFIFSMDPIAAGVFAGTVSLVTFAVLFVLTSRLFNVSVGLITVALYAVTFRMITQDRIPWPVILIPMTSLAMFYLLYKVITGKVKYLPYLALVLGFSFHVHFTSIFYLFILMPLIPIILFQKDVRKYVPVGILLFFIFFIPNLIAEFSRGFSTGGNMYAYFGQYFHGLHLTRVLQLLGEPFIEYESIYSVIPLRIMKFILPILFCVLYLWKNKTKEAKYFCLLFFLWFIVPLLVLSTYSGELSDYYFALTRPFVFISLAYITFIATQKWKIFGVVFFVFWIYYAAGQLQKFFGERYSSLAKDRLEVREAIKQGRVIEFSEGDPKSYLYYIYEKHK